MSNQSIANVLDALIKGLSPYLNNEGFRLKRKRTFVRKIEECRQELNIQFRRIKGQEAGYVEVCPNIIFEEVEMTASTLKGDKYKKGWPTAAANIGNLQSERQFLEWPLTVTSDISGLVEIITGYIERNAKPFWEEFSNLNQLINGYEEVDPRLTLNGNNYRWRLASAYCILKEYEKACSVLMEWKTGRISESMIDTGLNNIEKLR